MLNEDLNSHGLIQKGLLICFSDLGSSRNLDLTSQMTFCLPGLHMGVWYQKCVTFPPDTLQKMALMHFPGQVEGHHFLRQEDEPDESWRWLLTILFCRTKHPEIDKPLPFST